MRRLTIHLKKEEIMLKKGLNHFFQLSCFLVNMQFIFAPMAMAQSAPVNVGGQTVQQILGAFQSVVGGSTQNQQNSTDVFKARLSNDLALVPINPLEIPPVFRNCTVLPASGTILTGGLTCSEAPAVNIQAGYADALIDIANENRTILQNFETQGHARLTTQGIGCYEKSIDDFRAQLTNRDEALTKYINDLTNRIENLEVGTVGNTLPVDEYLELIKTDEALLTGQPSRFIKDANFQDLILGNNDQGCKTILSDNQVRQIGEGGGLRSLEDSVFEQANNTSGGRYTADQALTNASSIEKEIRTFGNELGSLASRRDGLDLNFSNVTYSSRLSGTLSASLQRVTAQYNAQNVAEIASIEQESNIIEATSSLPSGFSGGNYTSPSEILAGIKNGSTNYEQRISVYERRSKNECLKQAIASAFPGGVATFARSFRDPQVSTKFARETRSAFADTIASQLSSDNDIATILATITELESQGGNSRKVANLNQLITTLDGRLPSASGEAGANNGGSTQISGIGAVRPSAVIGRFVNLCQAQSSSNTNDDGVTNNQIINKLRDFGRKYSSLKTQAPQKIKNLLAEEILTCSEDTTTGTGASSCTDDVLNPSAGNFCVRTAVSCASNLNNCLAKTKNVVENKVNEQLQKVNNLKSVTDELKESVKIGLEGLASFIQDGAINLDGQLNLNGDTNFKLPEGLDFNLNANFDFAGEEGEGINSEFNLDDPKAILRLAQEKVALIREATQSHDQEVLAKLEEIKDGYLANYSNQRSYWDGIINECQGRKTQHQQQVTEQQKAAADQNNAVASYCSKISAFNAGYNQCDSIGDISSEATQIAGILSQQSGERTPGLAQAQAACGAKDNSSGGRVLPHQIEKYCTDEARSLGNCGVLENIGFKACDGSLAKTLENKAGVERICITDTGGKLTKAVCASSPELQTPWAEVIAEGNKDYIDLAIEQAGCSDSGTKHSELDKTYKVVVEEYADFQATSNNSLGEQVVLTPAICGSQQGNAAVTQKTGLEGAFETIKRGIAGQGATIEGSPNF